VATRIEAPPVEPVLRLATAADTPAILDLIATSYNCATDMSKVAYWTWKHEANPFGVSPCLVAESEGRIVGVRLFLRWTWQSGHTNVRAVRAVDTATHPDWRGRGVFSRLTIRLAAQMQREGVSFIYNTPNANSMPGYRKMGWTVVTRIPLWMRPLQLASFVRSPFGRTPAQAPTIGSLFDVSRALSDARLPAFLEDCATGDERYHTVRSPRYLRWRYAQIPGLSYQGRFEASGDAGALIIARGKVRGRFRELTISELLVTPSPRGIEMGRALLLDLVRTSDADYVAACAAPHTPERDVLTRARFFSAPGLGPYLTARGLLPVRLDPTRWRNWRCSIGDLELF
jgi:GNAT superfamily N-acetyltransferase